MFSLPISTPKFWSICIFQCTLHVSTSLALLSMPSSLMVSICTCLPSFWKTSFLFTVPFFYSLLNHPSMLGWARCPCFVLPQSFPLISILRLICSSTQQLHIESVQCVGFYGCRSEWERQNLCQMGNDILTGEEMILQQGPGWCKEAAQEYVDKNYYRQMVRQLQRPWRVKELLLFEEQ